MTASLKALNKDDADAVRAILADALTLAHETGVNVYELPMQAMLVNELRGLNAQLEKLAWILEQKETPR